jgi:hypothetical protein
MRQRFVFYLSDKRAKLRGWLNQQPNKSAVIVAALEMYQARQENGTQEQVGIEEIRQVFREELAQVSIMNGVSEPDPVEGNESPDVTQGMGALMGTWDFDDESTQQ